jgi:hypothetical protein
MAETDWLKGLTGPKFLEMLAGYERKCSEATSAHLPDCGRKAPECYGALGMVLALTDCAAACWWGCSQGDHRVEFLLASTTSNAYAAISLMNSGYYDQSLSLARTLGEAANLFALFAIDPESLVAWRTLDDRLRRQRFRPAAVRKAIEQRGLPVPINGKRYDRLSSYGIHSTPTLLPQAHGSPQPLTFPLYQQPGYLMALNEVAIPVGFIATFCPRSLNLKEDVGELFHTLSHELLKSVGGVNVDRDGRVWSWEQRSTDGRDGISSASEER